MEMLGHITSYPAPSASRCRLCHSAKSAIANLSIGAAGGCSSELRENLLLNWGQASDAAGLQT